MEMSYPQQGVIVETLLMVYIKNESAMYLQSKKLDNYGKDRGKVKNPVML
jgi:hypothetical protein